MAVHKITFSDNAESLLTNFQFSYTNTRLLGNYVSRLIERDKLGLALFDNLLGKEKVYHIDLHFVSKKNKKQVIQRMVQPCFEKVDLDGKDCIIPIAEDMLSDLLESYAEIALEKLDCEIVTITAYTMPDKEDKFCLRIKR